MKNKKPNNKVTVYFYRKGQYYAIKNKGKKEAYFPEIKIDEQINEKSKEKYRGYIVNLIYQKLFASNKVDITLLRRNTWIGETIKVKDKKLHKKTKKKVVRIDLDDTLWENSPFDYVLCTKQGALIDNNCISIIESINHKHYFPIVCGALVLGAFIIFLGLFFYKSNINSQIVDVTSFIMLISTILINSVIQIYEKCKKHKIHSIANVLITLASFFVSIFIVNYFSYLFENKNTAILSFESIGITITLSVIKYFKERKNF